jgi:hypothetical protein
VSGGWWGLMRTALGRLRRRGPLQLATVGSVAPDFDLPNHRGAQLRGRRVILWFYPKADTPG